MVKTVFIEKLISSASQLYLFLKNKYFKISSKDDSQVEKEDKPKVITPDMFDRSHLKDWHNNRLDPAERTPEVQRYIANILAESAERKRREEEYYKEQIEYEYRRARKKTKSHKPSNKYSSKSKKKNRYNNYKKRR